MGNDGLWILLPPMIAPSGFERCTRARVHEDAVFLSELFQITAVALRESNKDLMEESMYAQLGKSPIDRLKGGSEEVTGQAFRVCWPFARIFCSCEIGV